MKQIILGSFITFFCISTVQAQVSSSEQFFTAYQVSQVTGLSTLINQYAHNSNVIEAIAKDFLSKEDYGEALKKYEQDNGFKQRVQKAISDYLNSQDASQLYDTLATDVLADTYNYEELKILYQLYTAPVSQNFLANQLKTDLEQASLSQQKASLFQQTLQKETDKLLASYTLDSHSELVQTSELKTLPPKSLITTPEQPTVSTESPENQQQDDVPSSHNKE